MSKYPVGATWKGIEKETGKIGFIWLAERTANIEVWKWSWSQSDGSSPWNSFDWNTSYRACKNELPINCRMKRVKDRAKGKA